MDSRQQSAASMKEFGALREDTSLLLDAAEEPKRDENPVVPTAAPKRKLPTSRQSSSQFFLGRPLHFAQVHDIVGVVNSFVEPDELLALRQVNRVWKEAIDDQLEQKYDPALQQAIIDTHNQAVAKRYQAKSRSQVWLWGTLYILGVLALVVPSCIWPGDIYQVVVLSLLSSTIFAVGVALVTVLILSGVRRSMDTNACYLSPLLLFSFAIMAVGLMATYHANATSLRYSPNSTLVAECMTEKYTGNSPPLQVLFLRPERWHFGQTFVVHQSYDTGDGAKDLTEFYRYIIPNTTVAGMDVDCRKAFTDPQRYAEELAANGSVGVPTRNNSFPIRLGFSGNSQDTFWNTWPLQPVDGPIIYQVARNMIFFGGTTKADSYNAWTASPHWAYNRTVLVTRVQYQDLKGIISDFENALIGTIALSVVCLVLFYAPLLFGAPRRFYQRRRSMIGDLDEKLLVLKSRPSLVVVHRLAIQQQKQPSERRATNYYSSL